MAERGALLRVVVESAAFSRVNGSLNGERILPNGISRFEPMNLVE